MTWVKGLPCRRGQSTAPENGIVRTYFSLDDGAEALLGDRQEGVTVGSSLHSIHSDVDRAVSTVLETDST
jgi:hypothetical protein